MTATRDERAAGAGIRPLSFAPTYLWLPHEYRWIDGWADSAAVGPPRRVLTEVHTTDRPVERRGPLDVPDLHRRLASLEPSEDSIARFASDFGPLRWVYAPGGRVSDIPFRTGWWTTSGEQVHAEPESPADWMAESDRMRRLVDTWDAASAQDHRLLDYVRVEPDGLLVCWPEQPQWPWDYPRGTEGDWPPRTPERHSAGIPPDVRSRLGPLQLRANVAREAVRNEIAHDLSRLTTLRIAEHVLELVPCGMLAIAYAAFALEVTEADVGRGSLCLECGSLIVGAQRSSKRYCSERCKARAKRRRLPTQYKEDEQPTDA